jgi:hypothetical protein
MALVAELELPRFETPREEAPAPTIWIASDYPPFRAQPWPLSVPIPAGWREVTYRDAQAILKPGPLRFSFAPPAPAAGPESETVALSTAQPYAAVIAARGLSRVPREPRLPRLPRASRVPRAFRPARSPRAPRRSRRPRVPRRARAIRPIRKPRPRTYKTKQDPGICKGPSCTCWTPGGCIGRWYLELLPWFAASDCFRGPCYSYEACGSDKCQIHAACVINQILRFWADRYKAVAAWTENQAPTVTAAVTTTARTLAPLLRLAGLVGAPAAPPAAAELPGCPPGEHWTLGLTGCRCVPAVWGLPRATQAQVIACIGQAAWDALVAAGTQGETG